MTSSAYSWCHSCPSVQFFCIFMWHFPKTITLHIWSLSHFYFSPRQFRPPLISQHQHSTKPSSHHACYTLTTSLKRVLFAAVIHWMWQQTGEGARACVELCSSLSGPCKDLDLNTCGCCFQCGGAFFSGRILTMNESSTWAGWKRPQHTRGAGRSRHMQPSARPWTRSIRQHYILHYSSLGTESCQNSRALKGNQLQLCQVNPQGILICPVWPPDCF